MAASYALLRGKELVREGKYLVTVSAFQSAALIRDVYKITYEGKRVYLKVQINQGGHAVIVSFKEDESYG